MTVDDLRKALRDLDDELLARIRSCEPSGRFFRLWRRRSGLEWISGSARPFGHV